MLRWLSVLSQFGRAAEGVEELRTVAVFCGVGLDASLFGLMNGWM